MSLTGLFYTNWEVLQKNWWSILPGILRDWCFLMDTETFGAKLELFFITPDQTRNLFQKIFIKHYKQAHNIKQLFCFVVQLMYKTYSMCLTETQKWSKAQTSAIQHVGFDIIQKKNEKTVSPTNRGKRGKNPRASRHCIWGARYSAFEIKMSECMWLYQKVPSS